MWLSKLEHLELHHVKPALLKFSSDKYGVYNPTVLKYLDDADVEEILKDLPFVPRKIIKAAISKKQGGWWAGWGWEL